MVTRQSSDQIPLPIRVLFDVRIPMRDGITLSADVILPKPTGRYPVILIRTPYLKNQDLTPYQGRETFIRFLASQGYAVVMQDVRGRGDSEGEFQFYWADAEDGYDSIEWLAEQSWSDGRVGMMGVSYLGAVQWLAAGRKPPHLKCLVSTAPSGLYMDEIPYGGGAWMMEWALHWLNKTSGKLEQDYLASYVDMADVNAHRPLITQDEAFGRRMPLFKKFLENSTFNDEWRKITLLAEDFSDIDLPVLHVTGWFDGDQPGAMHYWNHMRQFSPARDRQYLVAGPWDHVQTFFGGATTLGDMTFGPESVLDHFALHKRFFDHYLKQTVPAFDQPTARIYVTGRNEWREYDQYPPKAMGEKRLYLHSRGNANTLNGDGRLSWEVPDEEPTDQYDFDPKAPAPSHFGPPASPSDSFSGTDLRSVERREDVLVYTTDALDATVEISGPVSVELYAASDGLDTDWIVRILDVQPDGKSVNLGPRACGILRARYRKGY
ncbi:MAG: CocE/NonD family hydrolase, partial [Deltaproteobacteria bacterium]|nr:CocE/NonD family hydrolase [Deltaproteobacteria bacterium]